MAKQRIHIIGIGGSGASGVARYLHEIGFAVSGSDSDRNRTVALRTAGLTIFDQHQSSNIGDHDLVLTSPGVYSAEAEVRAAKRRGIPVLTWQTFLGRYLDRRPGKGLMVAGTYGKGSTASIVAHILAGAYLEPLAILGVEDAAWQSNTRIGFGDFWVLEADEYERHFHSFHPAYAVLTSLEHEHITTYPTETEYVQAFAEFFDGMREPKIVAAKRTPSIDAAREKLFGDHAVTYSLSGDADVRGRIVRADDRGSSFVVSAPTLGLSERTFELAVPGRIHVENALGAMAITLAAGVDPGGVTAGLNTFRGLRRRFEVVRHGPHTTIFDYAHTPDRIRPVIAEARALFPGRRVVVLFEPHLFSRTKQFQKAFSDVLNEADRSYVTDIFPSREARSELGQTIHSRDLATEQTPNVEYAGTLDQGIAAIEASRTERDIVLVLGAGPIQNVAERLIRSA